MGESKPRFRVFATCDIGRDALDLLRRRGYQVEVYDKMEPPPKSLIVEKARSGIDGLITTLRDQIDAEVFEAGRGTLKVVAQVLVFARPCKGDDGRSSTQRDREHVLLDLKQQMIDSEWFVRPLAD